MYREEVAAIRARCPKEGIISTVAKSQGGECVIGISSFAKNDLKDPVKMSFVSGPANLNVWNTRQKRFHFVIGN